MEELDYALVKVSCEALSAHFQRVRKHVTRELAQVLAALKPPFSPPPPSPQPLEPLGEEAAAGLRARLAALREALLQADAQEKEILARCQRKLLAIAQPANASATTAYFQLRDRLDGAGRRQLERLIGEHLLRQGYFGALACLEAEAEAEQQARGQADDANPARRGLFDLDVFMRIQEVAASLNDATAEDRCGPALAWCADHGSKLRRLGSVLEFRLHKQHFLELVRRGERIPAVEYAAQHLSPAALLTGAEQGQGEVQQAMATLALEDPAGCAVPEYERLFAPERWGELRDLFTAEARRCYGLGGGVGTLEVVLQAGLAALKTPICTGLGDVMGDETAAADRGEEAGERRRGRRGRQRGRSRRAEAEEGGNGGEDAMETDDEGAAGVMGTATGASNCPVCHPAGRVLAAGLPFAHFNNSYLTCALTGARMDHENPPVALPNGRVYSRRAVQELLTIQGTRGEGEDAGEQDPRVRCPRTGETFPLSQARTIFII